MQQPGARSANATSASAPGIHGTFGRATKEPAGVACTNRSGRSEARSARLPKAAPNSRASPMARRGSRASTVARDPRSAARTARAAPPAPSTTSSRGEASNGSPKSAAAATRTPSRSVFAPRQRGSAPAVRAASSTSVFSAPSRANPGSGGAEAPRPKSHAAPLCGAVTLRPAHSGPASASGSKDSKRAPGSGRSKRPKTPSKPSSANHFVNSWGDKDELTGEPRTPKTGVPTRGTRAPGHSATSSATLGWPGTGETGSTAPAA